MKSGNLNFLEPSGPLQACNGTVCLYLTHHLRCVQVLKYITVHTVTSVLELQLYRFQVQTNIEYEYITWYCNISENTNQKGTALLYI